MKRLTSYFLRATLILVIMTSCTNEKKDSKNLVTNISEFNKAVSNANPGDVITLANGV